MRLRLSLLSCVVLAVAACNTPGPHFRDVPTTRVTVGESTFDIRVNQRLAEAVRINPEYAPRLGPIGLRAAQAMEAVSGCRVPEVRGDAAQITGLLDCGNGPPPRVLLGYTYECYPVGPDLTVGSVVYTDYDCDRVLY